MDNDCLTFSFLLDFLRKNQFLRFLCIGALNTAVGYLMFAFFIYIGMHYVFACFFGSCLGVLFNFHTIGTYVFEHKKTGLLGRFISVYVITCLLGIVVIRLGTFFSQNLYLIGALGTPITAVTGFFLNKHMVFHRTCHEAH